MPTEPKEEGICARKPCSKPSFLGERKRDLSKAGRRCDSWCQVTRQLLQPVAERRSLCTPIVDVFRNYTVTNPQATCARENGCDTCSSNALACQVQALKNCCCQQLLNMRSIRNRGTHEIIQPVPRQVTPFHTWLLHCFRRCLQLSSAHIYMTLLAQA